MNFIFAETSLVVVAGVLAVGTLAVVLYFYDSVAEAKEQRMKWLLRKRLSRGAVSGERKRWRSAIDSRRRDLQVAFSVAALALFVSYIFGLRPLTAAVISPIVFVLTMAMLFYLDRRQQRRKFEAAFPEAVEMLTRSVKTGVPLDEAFMSLAERFEGDLAQRFDVFQSELVLGKPFRDAGVTFCRGLNMPDVEFFFAVLSLNRESGSELSPTLEAMSYTLRERQKIRRRAVVLTSEIRSSAKVMAALPFGLALVMFFMQPKMFEFYLHDSTGQIILACCVFSILFGLMIIKDIANISE